MRGRIANVISENVRVFVCTLTTFWYTSIKVPFLALFRGFIFDRNSETKLVGLVYEYICIAAAAAAPRFLAYYKRVTLCFSAILSANFIQPVFF